MDTEQYEEAVRDYEKVYQTEKTSGKTSLWLCEQNVYVGSHTLIRFPWRFRTQAAAKDGAAGAEEEQEERLLQGAGRLQERHGGRDQESVPQESPHASPRYQTEGKGLLANSLVATEFYFFI